MKTVTSSQHYFSRPGKNQQSPTSHHIGLCLRRLREIQGISQSELARRAEINLSYICSVENHPSNISISKLSQLCNAMRVPAWLSLRLAALESERSHLCQKLAESWQGIRPDLKPLTWQVADLAD